MSNPGISKIEFAADSLLEEAVWSEPVSETGFFGPGELRLDSKTFIDGIGIVKAPFRARIGGIWFVFLGRASPACGLTLLKRLPFIVEVGLGPSQFPVYKRTASTA
jgi:hypothetical protein